MKTIRFKDVPCGGIFVRTGSLHRRQDLGCCYNAVLFDTTMDRAASVKIADGAIVKYFDDADYPGHDQPTAPTVDESVYEPCWRVGQWNRNDTPVFVMPSRESSESYAYYPNVHIWDVWNTCRHPLEHFERDHPRCDPPPIQKGYWKHVELGDVYALRDVNEGGNHRYILHGNDGYRTISAYDLSDPRKWVRICDLDAGQPPQRVLDAMKEADDA